MGLLKAIFGTKNDREIKRMRKIALFPLHFKFIFYNFTF